MDYSEMRVAERVELSIEVGINTETNFYTGFAENVSSGGIFVATHVPAKMGEEIPLSFMLPNSSKTIQAKGVVQWSRDFNQVYPDVHPGMGVRFLSLTKEDEEIINEYIGKIRDPDFYPES